VPDAQFSKPSVPKPVVAELATFTGIPLEAYAGIARRKSAEIKIAAVARLNLSVGLFIFGVVDLRLVIKVEKTHRNDPTILCESLDLYYNSHHTEVMTIDEKIRLGMVALSGASIVFASLGLHFSPLDVIAGNAH